MSPHTIRLTLYLDGVLSTIFCFTQKLMWKAADYSRWDLLKVCLDHVSPNFVKNGATPLDLVMYNNDPRATALIKDFLDAGADTSMLGDHAISALIFRYPLDIITAVSHGFTEKQLRFALKKTKFPRTDVMQYFMVRLSGHFLQV